MTADPKDRKIISEIVEKIKKEYQPERIILFGSYAYGAPGDDSDIDLLIVKETNDRRIDRRVKVRRIVSAPKRKLPLETLVLTPKELEYRLEIGDQFFQEI